MRHLSNANKPVVKTRRRAGAVIVWCSLLMVVLIGMVGLVIDGGLLMAGYRHAQNAADSAALAAAFTVVRGGSGADATTEGTTFVTDAAHNAIANATVQINIPPTLGPYAGSGTYVEAIVDAPSPTYFIHVLPGVTSGATVSAHAVAGFELTASGKGVMALDPRARPGLKISGQAILEVYGDVYVNSEGGGVDENGEDVIIDNHQTATTVNNNGTILADNVSIVGGVNANGLDNIQDIYGEPEHPLHANQLPAPDPYLYMPTPDTSNGVVAMDRGAPQASDGSLALNNPSDANDPVGGGPNFIENPGTENETMVLHPGIYESITVTGGKVRFVPGIYVLKPAHNVSFALTIVGGDVTAEGIMFYNTGDNYEPTSGAPDNTDFLVPESPPPPPDGAHFADMKINDSVHMKPLDTSLYNYGGAPADMSAFDGMLFYQRRRSDSRMQIEGDSADAQIDGSFYAKWGELSIDGQGTYNGTFVVGAFNAEGQGTMKIVPDNDSEPKAGNIFLVD